MMTGRRLRASVIRTFRAVRRGQPLVETDLDLLLNNRGFLSRLLRPLLRLVSRSWHLYPIGFLFALGFDTATEVALFGISIDRAEGAGEHRREAYVFRG